MPLIFETLIGQACSRTYNKDRIPISTTYFLQDPLHNMETRRTFDEEK
jgi:hypothetical protein